jgi:outer membrane protein assembly factor BamB
MNIDEPNKAASRKPLRLWPAVIILAVQLFGMFVLPFVLPRATVFGVLGGVLGGLMIVVWWLFFSRAPWVERLGAFVLMVVAMIATRFVIHESIAGGAMGFMFPIYAVAFVTMAFVVALVVGSRLSTSGRRAAIAASILIACGAFTVIRTGGFTGDLDHDLHWRWSQTPEERLLSQAGNETAALASSSVTAASSETSVNRLDWPGFRGPDRNGVARGLRIATDWSASPPIELWRHPIGPGWSSFAVQGNRIYTQEQRGEDELVTCYDASTGQPVWTHRDKARFYESNGGAGPRGTPTLSNGRVYTLGGTGILNALSAEDGKVVWSRNAAADTKTKVPGWGFASSPLAMGDLVVVATAGTLAAYNVASGEPRWFGPQREGGYSSPHRVTIDGVAQIVMLCYPGVISVTPEDGKLLWEYSLSSSSAIVQPGLTADGDLLVSSGEGADLHRIKVVHAGNEWKVEERWTSDGLKPFFNDFVVHDGHAYGFDNAEIACIDLKSGERKWDGGSYGNGQLVLLPDPGVLLVVSEQGSLALVGATPEKFTELAKLPAIKGKTWNHPVVAGDVLLVRNGEEMAAFRLPVQKSG